MTLNDRQFIDVYEGHPGEPHPDMYGREDDWRQDHRRWKAGRDAGKGSIDPGVAQLKRDMKRADAEQAAPYKREEVRVKAVVKAKKAAVTSNRRNITFGRSLMRAARGAGKPKKQRWW